MGGNKNKKTLNPKQQQQQQQELMSTLDDFTSKDNWDKFFTLQSTHSFEWYAEWPQLRQPLLSLLTAAAAAEEVQILVPGCGNSRLSEHLYDAGFHSITNIDFSKVVISDMLRRNVRHRPLMRWRLMDITSLQFPDSSFDVVLDKGALDALMEPECGPNLGNQYLSEVKRVLKSGANFICLTLAESHVLAIFFNKFRVGWEVTLHCIPQKPSTKPGLTTFMVVAVKTNSSSVNEIVSSFDHSTINCNGEQAHGLRVALETENEIRKVYLDGSDISYSLEDLKIGLKGDLLELNPGRRFQLILGGLGESLFRYKAVLLDAQPLSTPFLYHCAVFLVPKSRVNEWLFSSEEGQWMVVESSKAGRLIMILLDSSHATASMDEVQKDLSPLVKELAPQKLDSGSQFPFMMAGDGIKQRKIVYRVTSKFTGPIIVEDVVYENVDDHLASIFESKELIFRRLTFERTEGLVQSEALLLKGSSLVHDDETICKKSMPSSKSKKKENLKSKQSQKSMINDLSNTAEIDHSFLASLYHTGIIAGFALISSYLESMSSAGRKVETVIIGLGAGLLPMFAHSCMQFLHVVVVELDPVVLKLAKEYFGFCENEHLKVHVADGILFLKNFTNSGVSEVIIPDKKDKAYNEDTTCSDLSSTASHGMCQPLQKLDIIIIDVDSSDSSSGLSCPAAEFIEDAFLATVKGILSEQGLFVINLVSRSPSIKDMVISRIKGVFSHLFCLQLEEDVNEVLFAVNSTMCLSEENISEAANQLEKLLKFHQPDRSQGIMNTAKKLKRLK